MRVSATEAGGLKGGTGALKPAAPGSGFAAEPVGVLAEEPNRREVNGGTPLGVAGEYPVQLGKWLLPYCIPLPWG